MLDPFLWSQNNGDNMQPAIAYGKLFCYTEMCHIHQAFNMNSLIVILIAT